MKNCLTAANALLLGVALHFTLACGSDSEDPADDIDRGNAGAGAGGSESSEGQGGSETDESGGSGGTSGGSSGMDGGTGSGGTAQGLPGAQAGTWTYLVYMLADNNLEPFALDDLSELMAVGSDEQLKILVQVDRAQGFADTEIGGLSDFVTTKRVRVDAGELVELEDLGELNLGASETFSDFLTWGIEAAPAEHYAVILWDHGGAGPTFGDDASHQGDGLTLPELTTALDAASTATGLMSPLDLIGFDACLLGSWEVAVALQSRANYMLASEELEPGHGWDHRAIAALKEGADVEALGAALLAGYAEQAQDEGSPARITLALTRLDRVDELSTAIQALTATLSVGGVETRAPAVARSRTSTPTFGTVPGGTSADMIDLRLFVEALEVQEPALAPQVAAVKSALDAAVVDSVSGPVYAGAGGLSIFFPLLDTPLEERYAEVAGIDTWRTFIDDFHAAGAALTTAPVFTNVDKLASVVAASGGLFVSGDLAANSYDNLASATMDFGLFDPDGTVFFLGQEPANVTPQGLVSATWTTSVLILSQDGVSDYASYVLDASIPDVVILYVPFLYNDGVQELTLTRALAFDAATLTLLSDNYFHATDDGLWAEYVPASGAILVSIIETLAPAASETEWIPQSVAFDAQAAIDLEFVPLLTGTQVFVRLRAFDYAGQGDYVFNSGPL